MGNEKEIGSDRKFRSWTEQNVERSFGKGLCKHCNTGTKNWGSGDTQRYDVPGDVQDHTHHEQTNILQLKWVRQKCLPP